MKEALEFLQEKIDETNIPREHYEWEIAELMDWYADYYHQEQLKLLPIQRVSQQSELLMAYERFLKNDVDQEKMHNAGLRAEAFLAINCG